MGKLHRRTFTRACMGMMIPLGNSCGSKDGQRSDRSAQVNIAVLYDSRRDPFRNSQSFQLQRLVQSRASTELLVWDAGGNPDRQLDQLAAALAARPDFLIVFPVNPAELAPALVRSGGSGPRTFIFAEEPPDVPRSSLIVCADAEVGRIAGEFVVQSLRAKAADEGKADPTGRIVELTIAPPDVPHPGYSDGFLKSVSGQPGITLVHQAPCGLLGDDTAERMKEVLRLQKEFDVIFAHNDLIARAAAKAVGEANPDLLGHIMVLGADGSFGKGGGQEMIVKGDIDATIYRPPLVDLVWMLIQKCLKEPQFTPKPRYDFQPVAVNLETALKLSKTGFPSPSIE